MNKPYFESEGVKLYHGDCLEILPTPGSVDAVVTDPPYGMAFVSNYRHVKHAPIDGDSDTALLGYACGMVASHSKYVFCRWNNLVDIPMPRSLITWVKNNWSMGDLEHEHARQTEVVAFYPGLGHDFPCGRPRDVIRAARSGNEHHPSEKPVALLCEIISWTRGTVVDPFTGSGTTGVACVQLDRQFIGIEIEERYCEIASKRIEAAQRGVSVKELEQGQLSLLEGTA